MHHTYTHTFLNHFFLFSFLFWCYANDTNKWKRWPNQCHRLDTLHSYHVDVTFANLKSTNGPKNIYTHINTCQSMTNNKWITNNVRTHTHKTTHAQNHTNKLIVMTNNDRMVRIQLQKCNLSPINQNHRSRYAAYRVKKAKQKNTSKVKAVAGIASTVLCIR